MTIVNIRGTHGSGKSTVVRKILDKYPHAPHLDPDRPKKPFGYDVTLPSGRLYVVGSYETACGGCDAIQPYADIWPRVLDAVDGGADHVLLEGALVSSSYGNIGRESEQYGDDFVFAFLDTPLETCLERIKQRRAAKGNFEPLDPANTEFKFNAVQKSLPKIRDEFKRRVVVLDHTKPVTQVLRLLGVTLRKEPT